MLSFIFPFFLTPRHLFVWNCFIEGVIWKFRKLPRIDGVFCSFAFRKIGPVIFKLNFLSCRRFHWFFSNYSIQFFNESNKKCVLCIKTTSLHVCDLVMTNTPTVVFISTNFSVPQSYAVWCGIWYVNSKYISAYSCEIIISMSIKLQNLMFTSSSKTNSSSR